MQVSLPRRPIMPAELLKRSLILGPVFHVLACGSTPPTVAPGTQVPGPETVALAATFGQQGTLAFVEVMPSSAHPYFRVPAARYLLNGESLYAFEYASATEAAADAGRIAADGYSIGTTHISWVSDPHFYRSRAVIVLYVGRQADTLALLQRILGQQIAGA
jgi:hypothetical protein